MRQRVRELGAAGCLAVALLVTAGWFGCAAAVAAPAPAPLQLGIRIDDGAARARMDGPARYQVTVENFGDRAVTDLTVRVTLPTGMTFDRADGGGRASGNDVRWEVDLAARKKAVVVVHGTLTRIPDGARRVAVTACAVAKGAGTPVVCGSDLNAVAAPGGKEAADDSSMHRLLGAAGGVVLAGAVAAAVYAPRRRVKE